MAKTDQENPEDTNATLNALAQQLEDSNSQADDLREANRLLVDRLDSLEKRVSNGPASSLTVEDKKKAAQRAKPPVETFQRDKKQYRFTSAFVYIDGKKVPTRELMADTSRRNAYVKKYPRSVTEVE